MRTRNTYEPSAPRRVLYRWLALLLCIMLGMSTISMAFFSSVAKEIDKGGITYGVDTLFNGKLSLEDEGVNLEKAMHIIIRHWHVEANPDPRITPQPKTDKSDRKTVVVGIYIVPKDSQFKSFDYYARAYVASQENTVKNDLDGYYKLDRDTVSRYISIEDDGKVSIYVWPFVENDGTALEHFAGFSVSAGQNAVTEMYDGTAEAAFSDAKLVIDPTLTSFVHLVKAHLFYVSELTTVSGAEKAENLGSAADYPDYVDTYSVDTKKYYNTNAGLHTDKTASKSTTVSDNDDGRTFDLDLETWYNNGDPADVGMVLDASGSMGFTANTPEAIRVIGENGENVQDIPTAKFNELKAKQLADGKTLQNSFLNPEDNSNRDLLSYVLNPHNTNNSPLRSSGYTYFIYDGRAATEEFVPLGYWGGKSKTVSGVSDPIAIMEYRSNTGSTNQITLGTVNKAFVGMPGWYYINPSSKWDNYMNPGLQSGKTLNAYRYKDLIFTDYLHTDSQLKPKNAEDKKGNAAPFGGTGKIYKPSDTCVTKFYIDKDGFLRCFYAVNDKATERKDSNGKIQIIYGYGCSYVYKNNDQDYIKVEALQRALGSFVTELESQFPESMVSSVRFSTAETPDNELDKLVLSDWTADIRDAQKMLSNQRGGVEKTDGTTLYGTVEGSSSKDNVDNTFTNILGTGLMQYNYGLTGNTSTIRGLKSFYNHLRTRLDSYKSKTNTSGKKYLIIFTDGKDTDLGSSDPGAVSLPAYDYAKKLKDDGYTIYCVMLSGGPVVKGRDDYDNSIRFLKRLSGPGKGHEDYENYTFVDDNESNNYVYSTEDFLDDPDDATDSGSNSVDALIKIFNGPNGILAHIANDLKDYNVQDYIDPRFDLVDADGNVLHLGTGGKVVVTDIKGNSVNDSDGNKIGPYTLIDKDGKEKPLTVTLYDNAEVNLRDTNLKNKLTSAANEAALHYDDAKNMYYLVWDGQTIPGTYIGASRVKVWHSKITVRAKNDFVGGNAVLTNGNGEMQNYVYHPDDADASSGIDRSKILKNEYNTDVPSKGFPRTTVNVSPGPTEAENALYIYMGESYSSGIIQSLVDEAIDKGDNTTAYFWEYLQRYVDYYNGHPGLRELFIPEFLDDDGNKITKFLDSDGKDITENVTIGETIIKAPKGLFDKDGKISYEKLSGIIFSAEASVNVPYSYLPNKDNSNQTGQKAHEKDIIGHLIYTAKIKQASGSGGSSFTYKEGAEAKDTVEKQVKAKVVYEPIDPCVCRNCTDCTDCSSCDNSGHCNKCASCDKCKDCKQPAECKDCDNCDYPKLIEREKANETLVKDTDYVWDRSYKEVVGNPVGKRTITGDHDTQIVSGEIALEMEVPKDVVEKLKKIGVYTLTYKADLMRTFKDILTPEINKDRVCTFTATINIPLAGGISGYSTRATEDSLKVIATVDKSSISEKYQYVWDPHGGGPGDGTDGGLPVGTYSLKVLNYSPDVVKFKAPHVVTDTEEYEKDNMFNFNINGKDNPGDYVASLGGSEISLGKAYENEGKEQIYTDSRFGIFGVEVDVDLGELGITKTVLDDEPEKAPAFNFDVEITLPDNYSPPILPAEADQAAGAVGYPYTGESKIAGVAAPEDGWLVMKKKSGTENTYTGLVTLSHGQGIVIKDLMMNTKYQITEQKAIGYMLNSSTNSSGTITEEHQKYEAGFVNEPQDAQLMITKQVLGDPLKKSDDEFTFKVTLGNPGSNIVAYVMKHNTETKQWEKGEEKSITFDASNSYTFSLKDGEGLLLTKLQDGDRYTVTEILDSGSGYNFGRVENAGGIRYIEEDEDVNGDRAFHLVVGESGGSKTYTVSGVATIEDVEKVHYFNIGKDFILPKAGGRDIGMYILFAGILMSMFGLGFISFSFRKKRLAKEKRAK